MNKKRKKEILEQFNFDFKKEFAIYCYLCRKRRILKLKKPRDDVKFNRYCDWELYVKNKYKMYDNYLAEFYRFLNGEKRVSISFDSGISIFFIPFIVALLATTLAKMDLNTFLMKIASIFATGEYSIITVIISVFLVLAIGIVLPFAYIIYLVSRELIRMDLEKAFIDDYIEILRTIQKV